MHLILKTSIRPPATAWFDTHLCYEWDSCGTQTTFLCPTSTLWCFYFLAALMGCLGSPHLGFFLWSSNSQIQSLTSFVWTFDRFWQCINTLCRARRCSRTPSLPGYICVGSCSIWVPDADQSLIPNCVQRVWKMLVNSGTSWSLPYHSVVQFMYFSL